MTIDTPGVYEIAAADYHADCCVAPSLSASIAGTLLNESPRHAWQAHPRLNPDYEAKTHTQFDIGTAAHALLLENKNVVQIIEADDYRTKAAREAKDEAYAAGRTPLLPKQFDNVSAMVEAARAQLAVHHEGANIFVPGKGKAEQTLIWQDGDVWCRCRPDWLPADGPFIYDYKTTAGSASPDVWTRRLFEGPDMQQAFYRRGAQAVLGIQNPRFRFIVQETTPPYALVIMELSPAASELPKRRAEEAITLWGRCLAEDRWPGYPGLVHYVDTPPWVANRWQDDDMRQQVSKSEGQDLFALMLNWQAPHERKDGS